MPVAVTGSRRPTIAFLVDNLFDAFEEGLWHGVLREAESLDVNLLCFLGGPLWGTRYGKVIYDLVTPERVDGIIAISGSLGCFTTQEELLVFYRRYAPLPILSISRPLPGFPNLLVENASGIRQLVSHLVEVHGRCRIAFIRGPEKNDDANERFAAYRESLERHNLAYEPARVFQGDFDRHAGTQAIRTFLDERHVDFDAVIGANDYMAIYAMKELQQRGIKVPEDVAVAGFDDIRDAIAAMPSLTTVSQPLYEMGKDAVRKVLRLVRGESLPEKSTFATELVVRRSCGCIVPSENVGAEPPLASVGDGGGAMTRTALACRLEGLFPWMREALQRPCWGEELAGSFMSVLEGGPESQFLGVLEGLVARGIERRVRPSHWYRVLKAVQSAAQPPVGSEAGRRLDGLRETSLILVGSVAERARGAAGARFEEQSIVLQRAFHLTTLEREEFQQSIRDELPKLGIRSLYLSRYADETLENASLAFHYAFTDDVVLEPAAATFPSRRLVPGRFTQAHRYAYAVLPIHYEAEQIGFALCEVSAMSGVAYQSLINHFGRALKAGALLEEVKRHSEELEVRVAERTRQLEEAQQQLVETAHQAGMAEIAVGVMHNLGNLFNSVNISAEGISRMVNDSKVGGLAKANELLQSHATNLPAFFASDPKAGLLPGYYAKLAENLETERGHIRREAEDLLDKTALIRETIRALQEYARGGRDVLLAEKIELPLVIEAALKIQAAHLVRHEVEVRKDLRRVPLILAERAKVVHVLVNLVKNAVEAMRNTPPGSRRLTLELRPDAAAPVLLRISDTGEGIAPQNLASIFSYGFTTKPDGHGFGLHTCASYLGQMGGSIVAESPGPGRGSAFTLLFTQTA